MICWNPSLLNQVGDLRIYCGRCSNTKLVQDEIDQHKVSGTLAFTLAMTAHGSIKENIQIPNIVEIMLNTPCPFWDCGDDCCRGRRSLGEPIEQFLKEVLVD